MKKNNLKSSISSIDKLLFNGTHKEILDNLVIEIYKIAKYCSELIGEGYYGRVTLSAVGLEMNIKIGDKLVLIPVVTKEAKYTGKFSMDKIGSDLIISCMEGMVCEAIMLFILSKAWYKGQNIHMPLLVGIGSCDDKSIGVSHIILEKYGLEKKVNIKRSRFFGSPSSLAFENQQELLSFITNVGGLIDYISFNMQQNMKCVLPNNKTVYLPELVDNMCIFYLHTCYFLWEKYKMVLGDQSSNNVFVHWINKNSRCGKKKLANIKYINYDIGNNQYIQTNTNGIIFKIGDIGISIMSPQKNVMIVGNISNSENIKDVSKYKNKCHCHWDFIFDVIRYIPSNVANATIISKIIQKYNISEKYVPFVGTNEKFINSMPSELDILNDDLYNDLKVKTIKNNNETFTNFITS